MQTRPYLTCRQIFDFIMAYLDGSLPADTRAEFDRHLGVCPSCVAYLDGYRETIRLGRESMAATPAPDTSHIPATLLKAIIASIPDRA